MVEPSIDNAVFAHISAWLAIAANFVALALAVWKGGSAMGRFATSLEQIAQSNERMSGNIKDLGALIADTREDVAHLKGTFEGKYTPHSDASRVR